jgi:hypothetical protein
MVTSTTPRAGTLTRASTRLSVRRVVCASRYRGGEGLDGRGDGACPATAHADVQRDGPFPRSSSQDDGDAPVRQTCGQAADARPAPHGEQMCTGQDPQRRQDAVARSHSTDAVYHQSTSLCTRALLSTMWPSARSRLRSPGVPSPGGWPRGGHCVPAARRTQPPQAQRAASTVLPRLPEATLMSS